MSAIISQPEALKNSGAVRVGVDIEIGEGMRVLQQAAVQSHVEDHLEAGGVPVIRDAQAQTPDGVVSGNQGAAQLAVTIAMRPIGDPPSHLVNITVTHLQTAMLHPRAIAIPGLSWQENWASVIPAEGDTASAVNGLIDHLLDDFIKDYAMANQPPSR